MSEYDPTPVSEADAANLKLQARINFLELFVAELLHHLPPDTQQAMTLWTRRMADAADNLSHNRVPSDVEEFTHDVAGAAQGMVGFIRDRISDPRTLAAPLDD